MQSITEIIGSTDIYLVDQIMKGRYKPEDVVLDAGCGHGRNLQWFLYSGIAAYGVDQDGGAIAGLLGRYSGVAGRDSAVAGRDSAAAGKRLGVAGRHPSMSERFRVAGVDEIPFDNAQFDHVISSAVLHFARDTRHFHRMLEEMVRVLKPGGSLFIRMTSDIGIEDKVRLVGDGVYVIPDGSRRFLLTRTLLAECMSKNGLSFLEPFKTVNVSDVRVMCTLVATK